MKNSKPETRFAQAVCSLNFGSIYPVANQFVTFLVKSTASKACGFDTKHTALLLLNHPTLNEINHGGKPLVLTT